MRHKFTHECPRCGHQESLNRNGRYTEADYLELFHELMDEQRKRLDLFRAFNALCKARDLLEHRLAATQNDLAALRAIRKLERETA